MFAGHVGIALAIGRSERRVNVGAFVLAALLLDVALWVFVLVGWESIAIPGDFARTHQPQFVFPYSHGLLAGLAWSAVAGAAVLLWPARPRGATLRTAALLGAAVFSHWLLDALVHVPELPLTGSRSVKAGLGLWRNMPVALSVEALFVLAGLALFLTGARISRTRKLWLAALSLLVLAFTVVGMTVAPPPPSGTAMAVSSLVTIVVVGSLACWLGMPATQTATGRSR
jgi:hypothetical protein